MVIETSVEEAVRVAAEHLRECDTDELCCMLEHMSGAGVSYDPETDMLTIDTAATDYCGLFDELQHGRLVLQHTNANLY